MRRAARVDANQSLIVGGLRACGASVQILSSVGDDFPDLLVGHRGRNFLMEVKDGSKPPSKRKLSPGQMEWHAAWRGHVVVVENVEQAIAALVSGDVRKED